MDIKKRGTFVYARSTYRGSDNALSVERTLKASRILYINYAITSLLGYELDAVNIHHVRIPSAWP